MAALQSLSTWPAPDIERCLRKLVIESKALRKGEVLYRDGELTWDQAVAVTRGTHIPEEFVITSTVIPTEAENDRDIRQVILAWMDIQEPEHDYGIPILREQSVALRAFGTTLLAQVDRHTADKSSESSFADLKADTREWTGRSTRYNPRPFEFDPVEDYDVIDPIFRNHVAAYDIGRRGLRLGKRLLARLIRLRAPETVDPYERFEQRVARAIALVDSEVRLLAQVLSILAAHALMERWTFLAWRAYSQENGTTTSLQGHPIAALSSSARPSARMIRILPFPKFDRPQADQAGTYRNPTVERDQKGPRHYWSPPKPRRQDD